LWWSRRWWFFLLVGFWRTVPVVIAIAVGYALGHPTIGAVVALGFLVGGSGFSRWARAHRSELERGDRLAWIFTWYYAGIGALLVVVVAAWLIAKLA
jgi:uncharacterized membrane protein YidH (DUF202 family)